MSPIRAVLFDKDGTLIDYHRTWFPTNRAVALELAGGDLALSHRLLTTGGHDPITDVVTPSCPLAAGTADEIAALWAPILDRTDVEFIARQIDRGFLIRVRENMIGVPGLVNTLVQLHGAGLFLGVATSDTEQAAQENLVQLGVRELFSFVCGYDSGFGHKPGPGMVEGFGRKVGVAPHEICMVGDSRHDLQMGQNAGCALGVGVLTGPARREDLAGLADVVLDDIRGLPELLGLPGLRG